MMLLFLMCSGLGDGFLEPRPDIAVPLGNMMVVRSSNHYFLLDYTEALVHQYTTDGNRVRVFGGKGHGPGKFDAPMRLTWQSDRLIVHDFRSVHIYDEQAALQKTYRNPLRVFPRKVDDGWIGLKGTRIEPKLDLIHYNDDFSESVIVASWEVETPPDWYSDVLENKDELVVSKDGKRVFVKPRFHGDLWKYNVQSRTLSVLSLDLPPIPYDPKTGQERVKQLKKYREENHLPSAQFDIPETYPPINTIQLTTEGNLAIERMSGDPDETYRSLKKIMGKGLLLFFDPNGDAIEPGPAECRPAIVIESDETSVIHLRYFQEGQFTTLVRVAHTDAQQSLEQAWRDQICATCVAMTE